MYGNEPIMVIRAAKVRQFIETAITHAHKKHQKIPSKSNF